MALSKRITEDSGVVMNYHRITDLHITTNGQNVINVSSYTSKAKRAEEKKCEESGNWDGFNAYIQCRTYITDYDQNMTIDKAYEHLKTLPDFDGATESDLED